MKSLLLSYAVLLASMLHAAEPYPVKLRLISEKDGIFPGGPFYLGLHIQHNKGWHTYWRNPGDVGLAPSIQWELPKGFSAKPFQWASPELHKMGIIDVQSYHGTVTHIIPMQAPTNLTFGSKVTLKGRAAWLMCSKNCIPGHGNLSITLPVVKQAQHKLEWKKQFAVTRAGQPRKVSGWKISAKTTGERIELEIQPSADQPPVPSAPSFFCNENHITTQEQPVCLPKGRGLLIRMAKTEWAPKKIHRLTGHLHAEKGWDKKGMIRNLRIDIPLDDSKQ